MMMMMSWGVSDQQQQGKWKKGPWTPEEDMLLTQYVSLHGEGGWSSVAMSAGLNRSGKSCRLRWVNYLRPGLKRGNLTPLEQAIIIELHALWGNKWSTIARYLPGRTDNEIKNYWRTHLKKKGNPFQNKGKKKLVKLQNQQEENGGKVISPDQPQSDVTCDQNLSAHHGQHSMPSTYTNMENPHVPVWYGEVDSWSTDTIPMDGLWGCLWNFDDQNDKGEEANDDCGKMANQNRAAFDPYSIGFDKVDMHNGVLHIS